MSVMSNRAAVRSGQENLSLGELPSKTTLLGLGRRKVTSAVSAVTRTFPVGTWSVLVTTTTLSPLPSPSQRLLCCAEHVLCLGTLCFGLESATLSCVTVS